MNFLRVFLISCVFLMPQSVHATGPLAGSGDVIVGAIVVTFGLNLLLLMIDRDKRERSNNHFKYDYYPALSSNRNINSNAYINDQEIGFFILYSF